jgi:hypothetical protein
MGETVGADSAAGTESGTGEEDAGLSPQAKDARERVTIRRGKRLRVISSYLI